MDDHEPSLGELLLVTPEPAFVAKFGAALPAALRAELGLLPPAKRDEFVRAYQVRSRSLLLAYLTSLIYCHYGLLGRWAMTGMLFLSLFVAVTVGWVWWLIDLFRMPEMVRTYNQRVATEILRQLDVSGDPAPLAGA